MTLINQGWLRMSIKLIRLLGSGTNILDIKWRANGETYSGYNGLHRIIFFLISYYVSPKNGSVPHNMAYIMTPIAHISIGGPICLDLPANISGGIYNKDPTLMLSRLIVESPDIPKSTILI